MAEENARNQRGTGFKLLQRRAATFRPGSAARSFSSDLGSLADALANADLEEDLDTLLQPKPTKATEERQKLKMKAAFTRRWTFNEQLMVRPCGIIISRATFYEAESPSNALVRFYCAPTLTRSSYWNVCSYLCRKPSLRNFLGRDHLIYSTTTIVLSLDT